MPAYQIPDQITTKFAVGILKLVTDRGYEVARILEFAGVGFDPFDEYSPDYQPQISAKQYSKIYQQVVELLQDESFGVANQRMVSPGAFRMMCYAIIHCENLGEALRRASHFYRIFFDDTDQLDMLVRDGRAEIGYKQTHRGPTESVDQMEIYAMSTWHRFCGWLTGRSLELQCVDFQGSAPASVLTLDKLFDCPVHFNAPETRMVFDEACLSWPLVHTEQSLKDFLRTAPYQLMIMPANAADSSLVAQVRAMIGHDYSKGFPGFDQIARELNMSAPTLRRHLKREGHTFQQLKDECRRDGAVAYLARPDLSINAVAVLMGFTDPSAFHRSFKKWTGLPPGEYRRTVLEVDTGSDS